MFEMVKKSGVTWDNYIGGLKRFIEREDSLNDRP